MTVKELREYLRTYSDDMEIRFVQGFLDKTIRGITTFKYIDSNGKFTSNEDMFVGLYG